MSRSIAHDQARALAARSLDEVLPGTDQAALDGHLASCAPCTAVAAGYESDRLGLRALPPIEPPRDLWARTRVALEREHAHGPRVARRLPRRWGPVAGLGTGVALVLVLVIVGPTLIGPRGTFDLAVGPTALTGPNATQPAVTPIAVDSSVIWAVTGGPEGPTIVTGDLTGVCPTGDEPDCPPIGGVARSLGNLPTTPTSVTLSPTNDDQAIATGPTQDQAGTSLYLLSVAQAPAVSAGPVSSSGAAAASPTAAPSTKVVSSPSPTPGSSATSRPTSTPTPTPTAAATSTPTASSATPRPPSSIRPTPSPTAPGAASPTPAGTPGASAGATIAIVSNVVLVGDDAAYSQDGQWFAFSARPAGSDVGPDVYVWRAGWPSAQAITNDHATVFAGWVGGQILASRAIPDDPGSNLTPVQAASPAPSASASLAPSLAPSLPAASASGSPAPDPSAGSPSVPSPTPVGSAQPVELASPAAFLIDPATGHSTRIVGLDGWRPVVDPSGRWVAYWSGSLAFDPASGAWLPFQGQLEVASWPIVRATDEATGAAAGHPLPFDGVTDWGLRWDSTGLHLGIWIGDPDNAGLGHLSLLTIDPTSGLPSTTAAQLLAPTPAEPGFTLKDGQLVWATPPGQDGLGSHLNILAWTGQNAGKTTIQPLSGGALIVVH